MPATLARPERSVLATFVNSSDGFEDCWEPFFRLYELYGGELRSLPIYLNTERSMYTRAGLGLHATRVWRADEPQRPTWSECLDRGLATVPQPYVLYFQEDYFLTRPVSDSMIQQAVALLERDPAVGVVYLNRYGPQFRRSAPYAPGFVRILRPASYLVSTQAAIWRKDFLRALVRPWENGWMFEKFASARVRRHEELLISVAPDIMRDDPVIEYIYTGVVKGQWKRDCAQLFEKHGIAMDFSARGFYSEQGRLKSRIEVLTKLSQRPVNTVKSLLSLI